MLIFSCISGILTKHIKTPFHQLGIFLRKIISKVVPVVFYGAETSLAPKQKYPCTGCQPTPHEHGDMFIFLLGQILSGFPQPV